MTSFSGCVKGGPTSQPEYKPTPSSKAAADITEMRRLEALKAKGPEYKVAWGYNL